MTQGRGPANRVVRAAPKLRRGLRLQPCSHGRFSAADCETDGYLSSSGFLDDPAHRSFSAGDSASPPPARPVRCFPTVSGAPRGWGGSQRPRQRLTPSSPRRASRCSCPASISTPPAASPPRWTGEDGGDPGGGQTGSAGAGNGCADASRSYASDVASGMSDGCEGLSASEQSNKLPPKRASGKLLRRRARSRLRVTNVSARGARGCRVGGCPQAEPALSPTDLRQERPGGGVPAADLQQQDGDLQVRPGWGQPRGNRGRHGERRVGAEGGGCCPAVLGAEQPFRPPRSTTSSSSSRSGTASSTASGTSSTAWRPCSARTGTVPPSCPTVLRPSAAPAAP